MQEGTSSSKSGSSSTHSEAGDAADDDGADGSTASGEQTSGLGSAATERHAADESGIAEKQSDEVEACVAPQADTEAESLEHVSELHTSAAGMPARVQDTCQDEASHGEGEEMGEELSAQGGQEPQGTLGVDVVAETKSTRNGSGGKEVIKIKLGERASSEAVADTDDPK
jgi:hypothetical protein